jgi:hypothetical protein
MNRQSTELDRNPKKCDVFEMRGVIGPIAFPIGRQKSPTSWVPGISRDALCFVLVCLRRLPANSWCSDTLDNWNSPEMSPNHPCAFVRRATPFRTWDNFRLRAHRQAEVHPLPRTRRPHLGQGCSVKKDSYWEIVEGSDGTTNPTGWRELRTFSEASELGLLRSRRCLRRRWS